jgi:hypothetical protein
VKGPVEMTAACAMRTAERLPVAGVPAALEALSRCTWRLTARRGLVTALARLAAEVTPRRHA